MGMIVVVMVVIAMLVMVMVITVAMTVVMGMTVAMVMTIAMIVRGMIMRRMVVRIGLRRRMRMAAAGIGAAFGIERRLDLDHARAEPLHHLLDHVIAPDTQTLGHDLRRQMTVAEMPGDPDQMVRIGAANFNQRLRRRDHFDQPAVVEHQCIAAAQRDGVFQIEQEFKPARSGHRHAPPVPVVEIEHDGIDWCLRPAMLT